MTEPTHPALDPARLDAGFRLGPVLVEPRRSCVTDAHGTVRRLEPRAMAALVHLAAAGDVVRRDEFIDAVWQTAVSDEVVSRAISLIRQALGDRARDPRFVETIPKVGYRLLETAVPEVPEASEREPATTARTDGLDPDASDPASSRLAAPRRGRRALGLTAACLAALAIAASAYWLSPAGQDRAKSAPTIIAILPLEDQILSSRARPIGLGIADTLRAELGRATGLRVLARSSSIAIAREAADARELGERFGIDAVLEGSVVQSEDRVVVQLSLSDARAGLQRWARTFEAPPERLFDLARTMVVAVAREFPGRGPAAPTQSPSSPAYTAYLQGLHYLALRGEDNLERADEHFTAALAADVDFDPARVALARTRALQPYWSARSEAERFPAALTLLDAVTSEDPRVRGIERGVRGFIAFRSWHWAEAAAHFDAAIRAAPQDAGIRAWYAQYLAAVGDPAASLREALEAWDLDPGSPIVGTRVAAAYLWMGEPERSAPYYDTTDPLALAARDPSYLIWLLGQGRHEEVGDLIARLHALAGLDTQWVPACMDLVSGAVEGDARAQAVSTFEAASDSGAVLPRMLLPVWILAGEPVRAVEVLERRRTERQLFEVEFLFSPQAEAFRASPAYARALAVLRHPRAEA